MEEYTRNTLDSDLKSPPEISDENLNDETKFNDDKVSEPSTPVSECGKVIYNVRALMKRDSTYKLETFQKNYMMIFNQENVEGYNPRLGTEKDVASLHSTFSEFGFEIEEHKDLKKDEIMNELKILEEKDFTDYGCIVVVVLTHGNHGGLIRAKDMQYSEGDIVNYFKTHDKPYLVTKPKILIVQACRGKRPIAGIFARQTYKIRKDIDRDEEVYTLPIESDMLILHSSYSGNPSHRDELHGTWLIQALCSEIRKNASTLDFESILTDVKRKVAIDMSHKVYNRRTQEMDINKQMPVVTSTLIRKLYLKKFNDEPVTPEVFSDEREAGNNDVFDGELPGTPLLPQLGPCSCFLDHYVYLKRCLRNIVAENPEDKIAKSYLDLCETLEDNVYFNATKEKLATLISDHLANYEGILEYFKYLYLYQKKP